MSQIELKSVSVDFRQKGKSVRAVNDVSLNIEKGEIFGIVGLSGAGKSTLIRTINRLQLPSSGIVRVNDVDITKIDRRSLAAIRKKIGFIFQNFNLISNRNIYQNIAFALDAAGFPEKDQNEKIDQLLDLVGLRTFKKSYPSQLSGGQRQRVGIARALANDPDILLCDEATSALDLETSEEIINILKMINQRLKITIVFITHQLEVAKDLFDRVAVMENGQVVEKTSIYDLFAKPKSNMAKRLVSRFLKNDLPEQVKKRLKDSSGKVLSLKYQDDGSLDPIITDVAGKNNTSISVLQGRIEFIGLKAIGILTVLVSGNPNDIESTIEQLKNRVYSVQEVRS